MELELRSVEVQGAHEIGGRTLGGGAPLSRGQPVGPLVLILSPKIPINSKSASVDFQDIPITFLFYA